MKLLLTLLSLTLNQSAPPREGRPTPPPALAAAVKAHAGDEGGREPKEFRYGLTDLNGDRVDDAVVLLLGSDYCGSGGCTMAVFRGSAEGFQFVSRSTVTSEPIGVSGEVRRGWRTLIVHTRGGDALMRFDGRRYPLNPSTQAKATKAQVAAAKFVIR
jgi:hypothetical protein